MKHLHLSFKKLTIILAITLVTGGIIWAIVSTHNSMFNKNIDTTLAQVGNGLSVPLWTLDVAGVREIGQKMIESDPVVSLVVLDDQGDSIFSADKDPSENAIFKAAPLYYGEILIGQVEMRFSQAALNGLIRRDLTLLAGIYVVMLLFIYWNWRLRSEVARRKLIEAELVQSKEAAESANKAKSLFLANMSHELRTPLNAILGFSNLMSYDETLSVKHKGNLEIINRSGYHLLQLINDVLDMSKVEAGKIKLEVEDVDLDALIRDIIDMIQVRAEQKGLQLLLDRTSNFPHVIRGDAPKIRQILINLLSNAVKFTDKGSVSLRLDAKESNSLQIVLHGEVRDTGMGISSENIDRIFKPFVQLVDTAEQKGTGLGLAISRQFAKLMGGGIFATSDPGEGTTFSFHINVERGNLEQVLLTDKKDASRVIGLVEEQEEWRILIVEDQLENQLLLQQLLEPIGFKVRIAEDGVKAIRAFEEWHPHFIWMDRRMPNMDGLTATRCIRELSGGEEVKIATLTASVFVQQKSEAMESGCNDFVRKPYRPEEIFKCMEKHLGVKYLYEEEAGKPDIEIPSAEPLSKERITALPEALQEELKKAATVLDIDDINHVIKKIEPIDSELATTLRQRVEQLDFATIQQQLS
ncbi:MAG: ATP-binding protein [Sedimenticola sp.]